MTLYLLDFNQLATGEVLSNQYADKGVTISSGSSSKPAMVFDTANPTGGDTDLATSNLGKVLIVSEDGDSSDPDDNAGGGYLTFDFTNPSKVINFNVLDNEEGGYVRLYDADGKEMAKISLPKTGDNGQATVDVNYEGVSKMVIQLKGSGAVDNICYDAPPVVLPPDPTDLGDGIVSGTDGADVIDYDYTGDPHGDRIDHDDALLPGEAPNDDIVLAGKGDDLVNAGAGDDTIFGGAGNDTLNGQDGDDTIYGDSTGADAVGANVGSLDVKYSNVRSGSETSNQVIYDDVATLPNGDLVSARLVLVSTSNSNLRVDLANSDDYEILLNGNGDSAMNGETATFRMEFFNKVTGDPVAINSGLTFLDLDKASNGTEQVAFNADELSAYGLPAGSKVAITESNGQVIASGTENNSDSSDPDSMYAVRFEGQTDITFTLTSRGGPSGTNFAKNDAADFVYTPVATGNDIINGGSGDDTLFGQGGDDTLDGGAGNDMIYGGADRDTIIGSAGDTIDGGEEGNDYDTLVINDPAEVTYDPTNSENGTVTFQGGGTLTFTNIENVELRGGPLLDGIVHGTAGDDLIDYDYAGDPHGDMIDHNDEVLPGAGPNDDLVYAGAGNDTILAGAGDDVVYGEAGNDTISGGTGTNTLYGGTGDDTFIGGAGADSFHGGAGQDNLDYSNSNAGVTVNLTTGALAGGDAANDTILGGIDGVIGSEFDDVLTGFDGQGTNPSDTYTNQLFGNGGNDTLSGRGSDDLLDGGTGADTIIGGAGADTMSGGDDRDTFIVGAGEGAGDTIDGGEGGDDFDTLNLTGAGPLRVIRDSGNPENGHVNFLDASGNVTGTLNFQNIEQIVPCFTPGTLIATPKGERLIEDLQVGDKVITRDNGIQEIRWLGAKRLDWKELSVNPHLKPILVRAGSLGNGLPERDMMVSPNHRMLVANDKTALYFEEREVLAAAKHLVNNRGIHEVDTMGTTYIHFMFDHHEVVLSNGAWTESFQPGDYTLAGIGNAQRNEILELFPELKTREGVEAYQSARRTLKKHEARLLADG